jgi:predicted Abi (CAAX) family protease
LVRGPGHGESFRHAGGTGRRQTTSAILIAEDTNAGFSQALRVVGIKQYSIAAILDDLGDTPNAPRNDRNAQTKRLQQGHRQTFVI